MRVSRAFTLPIDKAISCLRRGCNLFAAALLCGSLPAAAETSAARPQHIVSLNLCSDELVLRLADRANIASVTWLSHDPNISNVADLAADIPANHGLSEEVLAAKPDAIFAGKHTTRVTVALLRHAGMKVTDLDVPHSLADIRSQILQVAAGLGEPQRGSQLVAEMDARLAALPCPGAGPRPRAIVYNPNGFTVGRGTLVDEILTRAGMDNVAADIGIDNYGRIPLELVAVNAVDILILGADRGQAPALATELLHHPIFSHLKNRLRIVTIPSRLWTCGGPNVIEAIMQLIEAGSTAKKAPQVGEP
jgi:iron complex transport system substrate-binding protein